MKIFQITLILIFSLFIYSCSPDPYKDCYKKNYKYHKDRGKPDHIAARIAKGACDKKN